MEHANSWSTVLGAQSWSTPVLGANSWSTVLGTRQPLDLMTWSPRLHQFIISASDNNTDIEEIAFLSRDSPFGCTSSYIGNFWDSDLEFANANPGIPRGVALRLWHLCDNSCQANATNKARSSSSAMDADPTVAIPKKRPRTAAPKDALSVAASRDATMAVHLEVVGEPGVARRDRLLFSLWETLVGFGPLSSHYTDLDLASGSGAVKSRDIWLRGLHDTSVGSISGGLSAFSRWKKWAAIHGADPLRPKAVEMASFLKDTASGGPTAALSTCRSLKWICGKIGIDLRMNNPLVMPWGVATMGHKVVQAVPLKIMVVVHWETLLGSPNDYIKMIAIGNLLIIFGVLRFQHVQRSRLLKCCAHVLIGECSQGKAKAEGVRSGYFWTLPKEGIAEKNLGEIVFNFLGKLVDKCQDHQDFLLHDFLPKHSDITGASAFSPEPLRYGRFQAATSKLLQCPPLEMSAAEAAKNTTYKGRRILPTAAGLLHLISEERAALGNWKDLSSRDAEAGKASTNMGTRYDASRLSLSARTKVMCVQALSRACDKVESFTEPLERLSQHFATREELLTSTRHVTEDIPLDPNKWSTNADETAEEAVAFPLIPRDFKSGQDSESPSSESSSQSEGPSDLDALEEMEDVFARYASDVWVAPVTSGKGKAPKLHTVVCEEDDKYKVACGKKLAFSAERFLGWASALGAGYDWCPGCLKVLPVELENTIPL